MDTNKDPTTLNEALEHLDKTYKKSSNIRVILGSVYNVNASTKSYAVENKIVGSYKIFLNM